MSHPLQEQQPPGMVLREMKGPAGGDSGRGRGRGQAGPGPQPRWESSTPQLIGREMCQGGGGEEVFTQVHGGHSRPWRRVVDTTSKSVCRVKGELARGNETQAQSRGARRKKGEWDSP